jgi:hypothetical protein
MINETTAPTSHYAPAPAEDEGVAAAVDWLQSEFPGWSIEIDSTSSWEGDLRPLWIARNAGHHPQAELTAAKLHTRLSDYLDREARRQALRN